MRTPGTVRCSRGLRCRSDLDATRQQHSAAPRGRPEIAQGKRGSASAALGDFSKNRQGLKGRHKNPRPRSRAVNLQDRRISRAPSGLLPWGGGFPVRHSQSLVCPGLSQGAPLARGNGCHFRPNPSPNQGVQRIVTNTAWIIRFQFGQIPPVSDWPPHRVIQKRRECGTHSERAFILPNKVHRSIPIFCDHPQNLCGFPTCFYDAILHHYTQAPRLNQRAGDRNGWF